MGGMKESQISAEIELLQTGNLLRGIDHFSGAALKVVRQVLTTNHLYTVAINDLLCMKNAGAQIAMDFS